MLSLYSYKLNNKTTNKMTELKEIQEVQKFILAINQALENIPLSARQMESLNSLLNDLRQNYALCEYCGKELVQDENGSYICENIEHND